MSERISGHDADLIRRADELLKNEYETNKEFNAELNGDEPLEIPSIKEAGETYKIEKSEALFWADRVTYNDELTSWENQQINSAHEEAIRVLEENDQEGLFRELVEAIRRNRITPFIGAGMSCASNFPEWGKALTAITEKIEDIDKATFDDLLASFKYVEAAELLWQADDIQVKSFIRTNFAKSKIHSSGPKGAILLLNSLSSGCIITTNYDRIIEHVVGSGALDGYMYGRQPGNNFLPNLIRGERCLLKLHGDADNPEGYVFTKSQYDEAYGRPFDFKLPLPKALRQIFVSHSLLFLGCSLVQDRTLELFEHVKDQEDFEPPDHFAILPEPEDGETRVQKENRLLKINVRPIWYPQSKHEYVERLLKLAIDSSKGILSV